MCILCTCCQRFGDGMFMEVFLDFLLVVCGSVGESQVLVVFG
jgi:hypothetical protein